MTVTAFAAAKGIERVIDNVGSGRNVMDGVGGAVLDGAADGALLALGTEVGGKLIGSAAAFVSSRAMLSRGGLNVALEAGKQGKHIFGHNNYIHGRSVLTHRNPQLLLDDFAGTGQRISGVPGQAGAKERVDFGQVIGSYVDANGIGTQTTKGIIHYSSKGAHIVPARP